MLRRHLDCGERIEHAKPDSGHTLFGPMPPVGTPGLRTTPPCGAREGCAGGQIFGILTQQSAAVLTGRDATLVLGNPHTTRKHRPTALRWPFCLPKGANTWGRVRRAMDSGHGRPAALMLWLGRLRAVFSDGGRREPVSFPV